MEGHIADDVVADCLKALRIKHGSVKFLGSYPSAAPDGPTVRKGVDEASRDAETWLAGMRAQIVDAGL